MLARREPRRPKEASLRRSISAAYYALFHQLKKQDEKIALLFALSLTLWPGLGGR
jgi:uncharacterized protein (UPF0332 family)